MFVIHPIYGRDLLTMNIKKGKVLVSTFLIIALVVAGCTSNGNNKGTDHSVKNEMQSNSQLQTSSKVVWFSTVDFWNPPKAWSTDPKTVAGAITEKTGLTFEFNIPAQNGATKLNLMLVSKEDLPDVMTLTDPVLVGKLIETGKVWDLEEFLKQYDPESHILKDFPSDVKEVIEARDGGFYAYPSHINSPDAREVYQLTDQYYRDLLTFGYNQGIIVNQNILEEAGLMLDDLGTEAGLLAAYQKVKELNLEIAGAPIIPLLVDGKAYQDYSTLSFLQDTFGAMPIDKQGNYRDVILAPETKHALEFLYKARQGDYFDPAQLTVDNATVKTEIASGRVFTFIGNMANSAYYNNDYWTSSGAILSDNGTIPVLGKSFLPDGGWMKTFISKSTKEPEKLAKWLSFMTSKEGMLLHSFGFEGVDYIIDDQGLVVKTKQGIENATDYMNTGVFAFWPFHHNAFLWSVAAGPTEETDKSAITVFRASTAYSQTTGIQIYNTAPLIIPSDLFPIDSDLANDEMQIKAYKESQIAIIIMAKNDAEFNENYEEMIVQLKKLGIDEIDQEKDNYFKGKLKGYGIEVNGVNS